MKKVLLAIFLILTVFHVSSYAQNESIDVQIEQVMYKHEAVGAAVVVVKYGQPIYAQSFGYKNMDEGTPLGLTDLFRIASISKSFTVTALMQLVEQGKISLDDDMSDLIGFRVRNPKFPEKKITLEMALSHTSSISDKNGYFQLSAIRPTDGDGWMNSYNDYAPGTQYQYCNLNYNMAGAILERLTGENFNDYIRKHILQPLDLYGGYRIVALNEHLFASIYELRNGTFVEQPEAYAPRSEELAQYVAGDSTPLLSPTGGLKISAFDLAKYMLMHMNYGTSYGVRMLDEASAKKMQTPVLESSKYGLGLLKNDSLIPGVTLTGHTGSAYGLYSNMFFDPEEKFGFIVVTNGCRAVHEGGNLTFSKDMLNLLYQYFIQ